MKSAPLLLSILVCWRVTAADLDDLGWGGGQMLGEHQMHDLGMKDLHVWGEESKGHSMMDMKHESESHKTKTSSKSKKQNEKVSMQELWKDRSSHMGHESHDMMSHDGMMDMKMMDGHGGKKHMDDRDRMMDSQDLWDGLWGNDEGHMMDSHNIMDGHDGLDMKMLGGHGGHGDTHSIHPPRKDYKKGQHSNEKKDCDDKHKPKNKKKEDHLLW